MFVQRVTLRVREKEKVVTGCWATEDKMRSELKYSKQLICTTYQECDHEHLGAWIAQGPHQEDHRVLQEIPEPSDQDCS